MFAQKSPTPDMRARQADPRVIAVAALLASPACRARDDPLHFFKVDSVDGGNVGTNWEIIEREKCAWAETGRWRHG